MTRRGLALCAAAVLAACAGDPAPNALDPADAVECRELLADVFHIRYETSEGLEVRTQRDLDHLAAQTTRPVSEDELAVLELFGWTEQALDELAQPQELSPEVVALLEDRPSCLEELRAGP